MHHAKILSALFDRRSVRHSRRQFDGGPMVTPCASVSVPRCSETECGRLRRHTCEQRQSSPAFLVALTSGSPPGAYCSKFECVMARLSDC